MHLALYDPSGPSNDHYWTWRAPRLDRQLLQSLYYDIASSSRPENPNQIEPAHLIGGVAQLTPDWVAVFRFGNGGRDARGRPGRFVIVAGLIESKDAKGTDLVSLLTCEPFETVLNQARTTCPVPRPQELEILLVPSRPDSLNEILQRGRSEFSGLGTLTTAGTLCAFLPINRKWVCRVEQQAEVATAVLECPAPVSLSQSQKKPVVTNPRSPIEVGRPIPEPCGKENVWWPPNRRVFWPLVGAGLLVFCAGLGTGLLIQASVPKTELTQPSGGAPWKPSLSPLNVGEALDYDTLRTQIQSAVEVLQNVQRQLEESAPPQSRSSRSTPQTPASTVR